MLSQRFIILAALLFPTLYAAPAVQNSQKLRRSTTGHALVNSYIVVLKDGSSRAASLQALDELVVPFKDVKTVTTSDWTVINGFAADLSGAALQHVLNDPNVAYVEENAMVQVEDWQQTTVPQNLVSESSFAEDSQSHFAPPKGRRDGVGTEIYVIDSGIRTTHETFSGRARWGASFAGEQEDKFEHGTYLASVAAGEKYGSAVKADIIAVKVLGDFGGGSWSTVINGIDFVTQSAKSSKKLGLAVLGVYGAQSSALDKAILNSVAAGVHYTVSAGTWELDPSKHSPAHLDEVVTVGAINSTYAKAEFSGSGKAVDIWYSGVNVVGASSKADDAVTTGSSTSAAASGVVGLLSCALSTRGKREPAALKKNLLLVAEHDVTGLGEEDNNARAVRF